MSAFAALLELCRSCFSAPSHRLFIELITGWLLTPGRRTVCAMVRTVDPTGRHAHDAYHRFLRDGAWKLPKLWETIARIIIKRHCDGPIVLDCDDTLFHKSGPRVNGAGMFHDAVRSGGGRRVFARGLNVVVITVRVTAPWGPIPLCLPINARLHRKHDELTTIAHAAAMIQQITEWFPDRHFHLCCDGAYAPLAAINLPRCTVTSRIRRNAALFDLPPPRTGQPGRPRVRGDRLPKLATIATNAHWQHATITSRGDTTQRQIYTRHVIWPAVKRRHPVHLIIVRDPSRRDEPDDYYFSTDLDSHTATVIARYAGRWCVEVTFRDTKQHLGGHQPQTWKRQGPSRATALALWLHAFTWTWYLDAHPTGQTWTPTPWYQRKTTPSFHDAHAALRDHLWRQRITAMSPTPSDNTKIVNALLDALTQAA